MQIRHCSIASVFAVLPLACASSGPGDTDNLVSTVQKLNGGTVGVSCMAGPYQNNWKPEITGVETMCYNFVNEISGYGYGNLSFYYGLDDQSFWETTADNTPGIGLDTVDLFFTATHGQKAPHSDWINGTPPDPNYEATWSLWSYQTSARSMYMRLGDGSPGTSIFSTFSCETMAFDGYTWNRYGSIFSGGLRAATGTDQVTTWCNTTAQLNLGANYAWYLGNGYLIRDSWGNAFSGSGCSPQYPSVMFTGNSDTDCTGRRDNMTWSNYTYFPRRRDSDITYWCGWQWDGI